jgi:maltose/moltooligosaccharide transporter
MAVILMHSKYMLVLSMVGVGIAWASTLSMPYAILAAILPPNRTGVYMGIFNFFVVVPEILASLFFGFIMVHFLHNNRMLAVVAGGVCMLAAAVCMQRVEDPLTISVMDV